jgi:hypothetical protein
MLCLMGWAAWGPSNSGRREYYPYFGKFLYKTYFRVCIRFRYKIGYRKFTRNYIVYIHSIFLERGETGLFINGCIRSFVLFIRSLFYRNL